MRSAAARVEGYREATADTGLAAGLALTDVPFSVAHANTENAVAYFFKALYADMVPLGGAVGDMARMSLTAESSSGAVATPAVTATVRPLIRGILGTHQTAAIIDGASTKFQLGDVDAAQYLYGALHVYSASGTSPTLDVTLESDPDASAGSETTRLTFTQKTAIGYQWATPVVGAPFTDTYWRVKWVIGGTNTPTFAFAVVFGIL